MNACCRIVVVRWVWIVFVKSKLFCTYCFSFRHLGWCLDQKWWDPLLFPRLFSFPDVSGKVLFSNGSYTWSRELKCHGWKFFPLPSYPGGLYNLSSQLVWVFVKNFRVFPVDGMVFNSNVLGDGRFILLINRCFADGSRVNFPSPLSQLWGKKLVFNRLKEHQK